MGALDSGLAFGLGGGGAAASERYAHMLSELLPPGRLWRLIGGGFLSSLLLACADELERIDGRAGDLFAESRPSKANELLPEYEEELDLPSDGTVEERRGRIIARTIVQQRLRPVDIQATLAPLLGLAAASVVVLERTHAMAASMGDDREIRRFFVYRDPALPGSYYVDSAQALLDDINRSTCMGHVIESVDFCCDDEFSQCDRDLLGA